MTTVVEGEERALVSSPVLVKFPDRDGETAGREGGGGSVLRFQERWRN